MKTTFTLIVFTCLLTGITILSGCKKDPEIPAVDTVEVSEVTLNSAVVKSTVISDGGSEVLSRGVCWNTLTNPTVSDHAVSDGAGLGTFTTSIKDLEPATTYYVRAYATNSTGTSYGNEVSFVTGSPVLPTLTTVLVQKKEFSVVVGGTINDTGYGAGDIIDKGICWSTDPLPTIEDNMTSGGTGPGDFTIEIATFSPGTTYYARAFVINSAVPMVSYGNLISFTTESPASIPGVDFPGGGRGDAISFTIGDKAYIGFGIADSDFPAGDLWEWDPATRLWTQMARFPGDLGNENIGFSIGTKGYVTSSIWVYNGYVRNTFWEFDPEANTWTQKASLPTSPGRGAAVAFSIGTKGYVGIGYKEIYNGLPLEYFNDFWEWDQSTDVWTRKADFPGSQRSNAVGFSIGNKGYIGTGGNQTSLSSEYWEYDQATDIWTRKADFGGDPRAGAVGFSIGNKGYIGTGANYTTTSVFYQDFWEWDQPTNTWTRVSDLAGVPRTGAFGFSIGNKAYVGAGWGLGGSGYLKDFGEYVPNLD